ncbi:hypothetical protein A2U01_0105862, partial [Trifolium medium]|nr:hypothetical protein [Trifolium medium]
MNSARKFSNPSSNFKSKDVEKGFR